MRANRTCTEGLAMRGASNPFALAIVLATSCLPVASRARDLHINAAVGRQVRVFGHVRFARDCQPGTIPDMTIVDAPKLGKLATKTETVTLTSPDFGTCPAGIAGPGTVVYYTAEASGDRFHYRMSS